MINLNPIEILLLFRRALLDWKSENIVKEDLTVVINSISAHFDCPVETVRSVLRGALSGRVNIVIEDAVSLLGKKDTLIRLGLFIEGILSAALMKDYANESKPWGNYKVISFATNYKLKIITVLPNGILSLQKHKLRNEHWYIVSGNGRVILNEQSIDIKQGEHVDIMAGDVHRISNTSDIDLIFIEIQTGSYFGEDDIERLEDNYGRA
jgi:mannose-6-phosphate isomerase